MECKYENDVKRVLKILDGNGKDGLIVETATLKTKLDDMTDDLQKIATAMSAIAKDNSNREAVRRVLGKSLKHASIIVGIFGTVITLIITLL